MQNSKIQDKDTQNLVKQRVKKILKLAGYTHLYSETDFYCHFMTTRNNFSQAFDIANLFIEENKAFINDYNYQGYEI